MSKIHLKNKIKIWILYFWTFLIFILMIIPVPHSEVNVFSYKDKIVHFFLFGIFSFLVGDCHFLSKKINSNLYSSSLFALLMGAGYAILSEILQYFIPSRTSSEFDFFAGFLGILFFQLIFYVKNK